MMKTMKMKRAKPSMGVEGEERAKRGERKRGETRRRRVKREREMRKQHL